MPQAHAQELEELNRELRQCNLQEFIQQTGPALPPAPRPDGGPLGTQVRWFRREPGGVGGLARLQADLLSPQDLLPPAREEPLTRTPRNPALASSPSPESTSVFPTSGATGPSCPARCPQPVPSPQLPQGGGTGDSSSGRRTDEPRRPRRDASKGSHGRPDPDDPRAGRRGGDAPPCGGKPGCPGLRQHLRAPGFPLCGAGGRPRTLAPVLAESAEPLASSEGATPRRSRLLVGDGRRADTQPWLCVCGGGSLPRACVYTRACRLPYPNPETSINCAEWLQCALKLETSQGHWGVPQATWGWPRPGLLRKGSPRDQWSVLQTGACRASRFQLPRPSPPRGSPWPPKPGSRVA